MILTVNNHLARIRGKVRDKISRDDPLILMRHALADRWHSRFKKVVFKELKRQVNEAADRVEGGLIHPVTDSMETQWSRKLLEIKRGPTMSMVKNGIELTDSAGFGANSLKWFPEVLGPGWDMFKGKADPIVGLEAVGYDSEDIFLHQAWVQDVETYLGETSRVETATTRKKIDELYRNANSYWDEEKERGLTPREVARQIREHGITQSVTRAELISRTTTMWAYNEGAHLSYVEAGVRAETWVCAVDDVLCEFCVQMDGQTVRTEDPFLPAGTEFGGLEGGVLDIPSEWPITHPPLHPMCRCALIPVIIPAQAQAALEQGERLRASYMKKVESGELKEARNARARTLRQRRRRATA